MTTAKCRSVNKPVGTQRVQVIEPAEAPPNERGSAGVILKAPSGNDATVFVGGDDVTTGNGFPLDPGETVSFPLSFLTGLYAVSTSGGQNIAALYG